MLLDEQQDSPLFLFFVCSLLVFKQTGSREKSDLGVCLNCALRKAIVLESIADV